MPAAGRAPLAPRAPSPRAPAVAPGAPRAPYKTSPGIGNSPRSPDAAPAVEARAPSHASEPPDDGWDAPTATALPDEPPRELPRVRERSEAPPPAPPAGLSPAAREEIWTIVRAAIEEAVGPVLTRQRELEARLERAERERDAAASKSRSSASAKLAATPTTTAAGASIPVAFAPSLAPEALAPPPVPQFDTTPTAPRAMPKAEPGPRPAPRGSLPPTGYGVVVSEAPKPAAPVQAETVAPFDMPDFGRRRAMGRVVVGVLLLGVAALVVLTILSHA